MSDRLSPKCCCLPSCRDFKLLVEDFSFLGGGAVPGVSNQPDVLELKAGDVVVYDELLPTNDEAYRLDITTSGPDGGGVTIWLDYELDGAGDPVAGSGSQTIGEKQDGINGKKYLRTPDWIYDMELVEMQFYEAPLPPKNGRLRITAYKDSNLQIRYQTATILFEEGAYDHSTEPILDCGIRWGPFCDRPAIAAVSTASVDVDDGFRLWQIQRRGCGDTTNRMRAFIVATDGDPAGEWETNALQLTSQPEPTAVDPYPKPSWGLQFGGETQGSFDLGVLGLSRGGTFTFDSSTSGLFSNITWKFTP